MRVLRSRLVGVHMDTAVGMLVDAVRMDGRHRHGAVDDATGGREDSNEHCTHEPGCGATTDRNAHGSPPQTYWSPRRNDAQRGHRHVHASPNLVAQKGNPRTWS